MSQADQVRQFVIDHYFEPAHAAGWNEVTIRAGDVHKEMGLVSRMPTVCSVLEGRKLCDLAGVMITHRQGPNKGANVFVTYTFETSLCKAPRRRSLPQPHPITKTQPVSIDPNSSLVLVSCVKSKLPRSAPARDLYTSTLFTGARAFARASGAPWYILSAKYGLVHPDTVIAPYEYTLNRLGVAARRAWANDILEDLLPKTSGLSTVVFLAGARYREYLIPVLEHVGLEVLVPMEGLRFGEQLQWLTEHT